MATFWNDVRYGIRILFKNKTVSLIAVAALALGIGANTAIFSVVDAVLIRPLPYAEPDRIVLIWSDHEGRGGPKDEWTNSAEFHDWQTQAQQFEEMAAFGGAVPTLVADDGSEQLPGVVVTHAMFRVLGRHPALGRDFTLAEDTPGGPNVVMLSHGLWQRRFGADPNIIGKTIPLASGPFTVIGVMSPNFVFPILGKVEVVLPMQRPPDGRGNANIRVLARLKPGTMLPQAQAEMKTIGARLADQYPGSNRNTSVYVQPLKDAFTKDVRAELIMLLGAVGFVLLIACANVANLLLARASARRREIGIRLAMGAARGRILRQLLTESCLLGLAGGVAGIVLAAWAMDFLSASLPRGIGSFTQVRLDGTVLAFTFLLSVFTGLFFGLAPALQSLRRGVSATLQEGSRGLSGGRQRHLLRNAFVVVNFALALSLSIGAGLFLQSFSRLKSVDLGYRPENLVSARVTIPASRYPEGPQITAFVDQMVERLRAVPGVRAVSASFNFPLIGGNTDTGFVMEGRPRPEPDQIPAVWFNRVTPEFHSTLGIRLIEGRLLTERDAPRSPLVVLVNESFARRHFPGESPVGKRIGSPNPENPNWREIVGVVSNIKYSALNIEEPPSMYLPFAQAPGRRVYLAVRSDSDAAALVPAIRTIIGGLDRTLALGDIATMEERVHSSLAQPRLTTTLIGFFAGLALLLAAVGVFGVMSYAVAQRTHEIGIRMAVGAGRKDVLRMVLWEGVLLAAVGIVIGLGGTWALSRFVSSLLFGMEAVDPATYAAVAAFLLLVALAACYFPARRATRVDPTVALRYE